MINAIFTDVFGLNNPLLGNLLPSGLHFEINILEYFGVGKLITLCSNGKVYFCKMCVVTCNGAEIYISWKIIIEIRCIQTVVDSVITF